MIRVAIKEVWWCNAHACPKGMEQARTELAAVIAFDVFDDAIAILKSASVQEEFVQ
jgi:hypothetical protein